MTKSYTEINFLDVKIMKDNGTLQTTLYSKSMDRNNLLRYNSPHARFFFGIPRGQFIRARKICSGDYEYEKSKNKLNQKFTTKGYNAIDIEGRRCSGSTSKRRVIQRYT